MKGLVGTWVKFWQLTDSPRAYNKPQNAVNAREVCKTFMRRFDPDPRLHHFIDIVET